MNNKNVILALSLVTAAAALLGQPAGAQLNTQSSTQSSTQAGSLAGATNSFPILGGGGDVLTPTGIEYMPRSSPNPYFTRKITPDAVAARPVPQQKGLGVVTNYYWSKNSTRPRIVRQSIRGVVLRR